MKNRKSKYFIVILSLLVAALHFLFGPGYQGPLKYFVRGYLIDILLPLNLYLLLQLPLRDRLPLKTARVTGAVSVILIGATVELLQFYKIAIFGSTYDPLDLVMYALGTGTGILVDLTIISKFENASQ